ncbi:MAG TPA: regulatory protein RecX [Candidatus Dormibacteraeota bacterium]|nr:regulatory protein RecX [Candidatus Dormibacteraeota bacterium]
MEIAVRFLGTRPRSRSELERRLRRAGAKDDVIAATLERLMELGQVDDLAFARWWAEERDRHAPRGRRLVEAELRQRGIPREVLESLRNGEPPEPAPDAEGLPSSEAERARIALNRHLRGRPMPDDRKAIQRLGMFLMRRGFDPETVRSTLRAAADGVDDPD